MAFTPPPWYDDPQLRSDFVARFTRELTGIAFSAPWPDAVQDRSDCASYAGEYDPLPNDYWAYACRTRSEFGVRTDYAYLIGESEHPTRERVRYSISAPAEARVADWEGIRDSLIAGLDRARSPRWHDDDRKQIGVADDRVFEVALFVTYPDTVASRFTLLSFPTTGRKSPPPAAVPPRYPRTTVDSIVVETFSRRLDAETHESNWNLLEEAPPDSSVQLTEARANIVRALRERHPALAAAAESSSVTSGQIRTVAAELAKVRSLRSVQERDLVLYGAHVWAKRLLALLPATRDGCAGGENAFVDEFNSAFQGRFRSWIECGHYGDWWYSGGFIDSVVVHAGADRWADDALLERSMSGWNLRHGCSDDPAIGADEFRPVIERGEAFLKSHAGSAIAPELRLLIAEAHETAWSLSKGGNIMSAGWMSYATEAPIHRERAMALYAEHLKKWPDHWQNKSIRKRLSRMRIDVDTGYWRFWCSDE
jgi:hypothetical protein